MPRRALPELPIAAILPALANTLAAHTRVLVHAPPGAGKSTLLPLSLLDSPWLGRSKILMLEPRRVAARAVAARMARLRDEEVGHTVGVRTRLDTRVSRATRIEVVTEGILTRMLQANADLPGVGCVIFDEFHERSLHADLGLALCAESQQTLREDLRIIVMSATLDLAPLSRMLGDAPVITASGRSFEVATRYVPPRPEVALELHAAQVVRRALEEHEGDLLCFLPGVAEIGRVERTLASFGLPREVGILPLYGELSPSAQDAALAPAPPGRRKIVLATTIAETSLTIEGVRVVVDAGLRRHGEFDPASGMSRLVTVRISQAAAEQRRGRAGRLSSGVCYRLWSEGSHASLAPQTTPEIRHADLAPLALELACWGNSDPGALRWLDQPPPAPLAQARDLLRQLEALDRAGRITAHGRTLATLGAHPRLAHMLVRARSLGAARLACDLAALLSERDVLRSSASSRDADVRLRVAVLRGANPMLEAGVTLDHRSLERARRLSADWQRSLPAGPAETADPHEDTGTLLALAYPDRVARTRGADGRYVLINGRGARFAEPQALAKAPFIVAAELDGSDREARIFLAAPLALAAIERQFAAHIETQASVLWDEREARVVARSERRIGSLVLHVSDLHEPDAERVRQSALSGLKQLGLSVLPWTRELKQWQARVALLRRHGIAADAPWPDVTDAALAASLDAWAAPWIDGCTRREHFSRIDLKNALLTRLSYGQAAILDREAPTHFVVPSGSRVPIDYLDGDQPTLAVRLQEVFGMRETPSVAAGRVALLLKLLSPAGRPVQITRDLVSFWNHGYHDVKKDLKGRYPKHYWPDDPHAATPTRRARPR